MLVSGHYTRSDHACSSPLWDKKQQALFYGTRVVLELAFVLCPFLGPSGGRYQRSVKGSCPDGGQNNCSNAKVEEEGTPMVHR